MNKPALAFSFKLRDSQIRHSPIILGSLPPPRYSRQGIGCAQATVHRFVGNSWMGLCGNFREEFDGRQLTIPIRRRHLRQDGEAYFKILYVLVSGDELHSSYCRFVRGRLDSPRMFRRGISERCRCCRLGDVFQNWAVRLVLKPTHRLHGLIKWQKSKHMPETTSVYATRKKRVVSIPTCFDVSDCDEMLCLLRAKMKIN